MSVRQILTLSLVIAAFLYLVFEIGCDPAPLNPRGGHYLPDPNVFFLPLLAVGVGSVVALLKHWREP